MAKHMRRLGRANTSRRSRRRRCRRRNPVFAGLILPARILANGAVSILAAVTTPFASVVRVTGAAMPIVVQLSAGMGSKDAAKCCAMKVNRLFATAGAGEVLPLNSACCYAIKMPDADTGTWWGFLKLASRYGGFGCL
jgi:hypothetical protein